MTGGLVVDSVGMSIGGISNKDTLIRSWFKLRQTIAFLANEALATEDLEVRYVRLLARENLIGSLVQVLVEI